MSDDNNHRHEFSRRTLLKGAVAATSHLVGIDPASISSSVQSIIAHKKLPAEVISAINLLSTPLDDLQGFSDWLFISQLVEGKPQENITDSFLRLIRKDVESFCERMQGIKGSYEALKHYKHDCHLNDFFAYSCNLFNEMDIERDKVDYQANHQIFTDILNQHSGDSDNILQAIDDLFYESVLLLDNVRPESLSLLAFQAALDAGEVSSKDEFIERVELGLRKQKDAIAAGDQIHSDAIADNFAKTFNNTLSFYRQLKLPEQLSEFTRGFYEKKEKVEQKYKEKTGVSLCKAAHVGKGQPETWDLPWQNNGGKGSVALAETPEKIPDITVKTIEDIPGFYAGQVRAAQKKGTISAETAEAIIVKLSKLVERLIIQMIPKYFPEYDIEAYKQRKQQNRHQKREEERRYKGEYLESYLEGNDIY